MTLDSYPAGASDFSERIVELLSRPLLLDLPENPVGEIWDRLVALGVADASGVLVRGKTARVSITDASAGVTLSLSLKSGDEYTVLVGLQTLRDIG